MRKNKKNLIISAITVILFFAGFVGSLVFNSTSLTLLTYPHTEDVIKNYNNDFLRKGDVISGEFESKEDGLGIISLKFDKKNKINFEGNDRLFFKLRPSDSPYWHSETFHSLAQAEQTFVLPFGIPLLADSKGKKFYFEIESLEGNGENSVRLSQYKPNILTSYKFTRQYILENPNNFIRFLSKKIEWSILNRDFLIKSIPFMLPMLIWLLFNIVRSKANFSSKILSYLSISFILLDSFLFTQYYMGLTLFVIAFWISSVVIHRLGSSVSLMLCLALLILAVVSIVLTGNENQNKISIYIYFLLLIGVTQLIIEFRNKDTKRVGVEAFLKEIIRK